MVKIIEIINEEFIAPNECLAVVFADSKEELSSEYSVSGLPTGRTLAQGSKFKTADGSEGYLKSDGTIEWVVEPSDLPPVDSTDDGKVLQVVDGEWEAAEFDALPPVTGTDDGKVLTVKNGAWAVDECPVTQEEIANAVEDYCQETYSEWSGALDPNLESNVMAAPANKVGELKSALTEINNALLTYKTDKNFTYTATEVTRTFVPFEFIKDRKYVVTFKVNAFPETAGAILLSIQTTTTRSTSTIVDAITGNVTEVTIGATVSNEFVASADAHYYYLYTSGVGSINIDVSVITDEFQDIANKFSAIEDEFDAKESEIVRNEELLNESLGKYLYKYALSYEHTANTIVRTFIPYKIIGGKTYTVKMVVASDYTTGDASDAFQIRTTTAKSTSTIVDAVCTMFSGDLPRGTYYFKFTATNDAKWLYVFQKDNSTSFSADFSVYGDISIFVEGTDKNYTYGGQRIRLNEYSYDLDEFMTTDKPASYSSLTWQGSTVYGNKFFRAVHSGKCAVYDLSTKNATATDTFDLASAGEDNHAGCMNFSNKFYADGDAYPLLYVSGSAIGDFKCSVERLSTSGTSITGSTLVQTITLDQTNFTEADLESYWGQPCWIVSNNALYCFGAKYRTTSQRPENFYIVTKFAIPDTSESSVTLTASDVLEQWTSPFDTMITQGCCIHNDYLFSAYGYGGQEYPDKIKVFSLSQKSCIAMLDINETSVGNSIELQDLCVWQDTLICGNSLDKVYGIIFA